MIGMLFLVCSVDGLSMAEPDPCLRTDLVLENQPEATWRAMANECYDQAALLSVKTGEAWQCAVYVISNQQLTEFQGGHSTGVLPFRP